MRMKHTDGRDLLSTGCDSSNLIEMVPADKRETGLYDHDWRGPYYLFLREGQGETFHNVYVAGPVCYEDCKKIKTALRTQPGRVKHWNENLRQFIGPMVTSFDSQEGK